MQDPSPQSNHLGSLQKLPTGIEGFDDVCQGGLPIGRSTLISGTSGTGKTVFSLNFLYNGIRQRQRGDPPQCLGGGAPQADGGNPEVARYHPYEGGVPVHDGCSWDQHLPSWCDEADAAFIQCACEFGRAAA